VGEAEGRRRGGGGWEECYGCVNEDEREDDKNVVRQYVVYLRP